MKPLPSTDHFLPGLAGNIKMARIRRGLTQQNVATLVGVDYKTYQKYEYGEVNPPASNLKRLTIIFNCSADELLSGSAGTK
jgi:transcriptional regulator with XRE-family HTH domain